jgi:hypothetical protein
MSRARMLRLALLSFVCTAFGCNQWWADRMAKAPAKPDHASAIQQTQPAAETQPAPEDNSPLAQQMKAYLERVDRQNTDLRTTSAPAGPLPPSTLFTGEPSPNSSAFGGTATHPARSGAANDPTLAQLPQPAALDPNATTQPVRPRAKSANAGAAKKLANSLAQDAATPGNLLSPIAPAPAPAETPPATKPAPASEVVASPKPPAVHAALSTQPHAGPNVELVDVRPVVNAAVNPTTQPSSANQAVQGKGGSTADLNALLQQLEAAVVANPQQLDDQFRLRLMYALTGQDDKSVGPIVGADPIQADLVTAVFKALSAARRSLREPAAGGSAALVAVDELRRLVAQQSPVIIPKVVLVTRVNSFGDYDAVQPPRFTAGQPIHVFIYAEVANFRSEPTPDSRLHTLLAERVEIFDGTGKVIWQRAESNIEDRVLTPRHDFFTTLDLQLPADLPAGDYVLKVTVEDKLGATTDQQRLTFTIAPK